jgi:hypothetical protein
MPKSVQIDPTTGEVSKEQTSVWLPPATFIHASYLARRWSFPPYRFFSRVVQRAVAEAFERELAKEGKETQQAAVPPSEDSK